MIEHESDTFEHLIGIIIFLISQITVYTDKTFILFSFDLQSNIH